jgi:hypothetical protein
VKHEHSAITAVGEESAAQVAIIMRRFDLAFGFGVKFAQFLQGAVLVLIEQFHAHRGGQVDGIAAGDEVFLFALLLPFVVSADAAKPLRFNDSSIADRKVPAVIIPSQEIFSIDTKINQFG